MDGTPLLPPDTLQVDPLINSVIDGRYRVDCVIGAGGFGTVYKAIQLNVERPVAIKVLSASASKSSDTVRRFIAEAKVISKLRHPNTLKLHDYGRTSDGQIYLVTEFLDGHPLDRLIEMEGALSPDRTLRLLSQVLAALSEAHEHGIVHRDLKPANIFVELVGGEEQAKVIDFGIARINESTVKTTPGAIMGTPAYMSPEQAKGSAVGPASDLYSLGVVAFECLTGHPPFTGTTAFSLLYKHMQASPPSLLDSVKSLPVPLDGLVQRMLAKTPAARFESAKALRAEVESMRVALSSPTPQAPIQALSATAEAVVPVVPQAEPPESSERPARPLWWWGALAGAAAIVALVAVLAGGEPVAEEASVETAAAVSEVVNVGTLVVDAAPAEVSARVPDAAPKKAPDAGATPVVAVAVKPQPILKPKVVKPKRVLKPKPALRPRPKPRPKAKPAKVVVKATPRATVYQVSRAGPLLTATAVDASGAPFKGSARWRLVKGGACSALSAAGKVSFKGDCDVVAEGCVAGVCARQKLTARAF